MFVSKATRIVGVLMLGSLFSLPPASAAPKGKTPPKAPTNLQITATGPTSISLAWNAPTGNSSNFWYIVQGCGGSFRVDPPLTTFTNSNLWPQTTYTCFVYAVNAAGHRSANSNSVSYTTPADTTPPSPPPTLTATRVVPTWISVEWTVSKDNVSQVWYTLLVDGSPYVWDAIGLQFYTVMHLAPSTTHVLQVTARDAFGNTAHGNVLSVTTPPKTDFTPPTAPSNLTLGFQSTEGEEAWLNWTQSSDDSDPQSLILYDVYLNGVRNNDGVFGYGSTVTYCGEETGPTTIVVKAVDTNGNVSAPSNEILFQC